MAERPSAQQGYTILGAISFLAAMGITAWGQPDLPKVAWQWTAPTTGSPVAHYVGEMRVVDYSPADTFYVPIDSIPICTPADDCPPGAGGVFEFDYQYGREVSFRVAGVDSLGRQGPWSLWADPWRDNGPPSEPGQPTSYLQMRSQ